MLMSELIYFLRHDADIYQLICRLYFREVLKECMERVEEVWVDKYWHWFSIEVDGHPKHRWRSCYCNPPFECTFCHPLRSFE